MGRRALPNNVHILQGNRSKKPGHALRDTINPDVEVPGCPSHLLPDAKKEWKRIAPELEKMRIISQMDRAALAVYCQAYARWVQAESKIKELSSGPNKDAGLIDLTPNGFKQMSVWLQISNRAVEQMHKFLAEFGMSPSSRSKIREAQSPNMDLFNDEPQKGPGKFFDR
ncbi:MAG: phage terminase small subunit P27 family [Methylobacter sp.]